MTVALAAIAMVIVASLFVRAWQSRTLLLIALLAFVVGLIATSTPRMLGDSQDYVVMALNLVRGEVPSLSQEDLQRAAERYPGDISKGLVIPEYRGVDGRQDLSHFWFYPLLAAPFVRIAVGMGLDPITGFTVLNVILFGCAAIVLERHHSPAVTVLIAAGPIVWWVDKAHTEVFTFSLLTTAVVLLRTAPWWSVVALGTAATQNPPIAGAMLVAIGYGFAAFGWRDRRLWQGAAGGFAIAALHPLYYQARLGLWSALSVAVDRHWPDFREVITPAIDPNLGIFINDLPLTIAVTIALVLALSDPRRSPRRIFLGERAAIVAVAALFLFSFTQTTNVNSGGTPGTSRYGLWLIPLTIPVLATAAAQATWIRVLAVVSLVWCATQFAPSRPERFLSPSAFATMLWEHWPSVDNPVAEVFAERAGGREPAVTPPIATAGCEKVLVAGTGSAAPWPDRCGTIDVPPDCRLSGVFCYANRRAGSYAFVRAPTTPLWSAVMAGTSSGRSEGHQTLAADYALPPDQPPAPVAWLDSDWSYVERTDATNKGPAVAWRWMAEHAGVHLLSPAATNVRVRIVLRAYGKARRLRISAGGIDVAQFLVAESPRDYETPPFAIPAGPVALAFDSLDGADAARGGDPRRLGIALFHFEIVIADR